MEISPSAEIVDLGLWLSKEKALILSDFHLGYEEYLQQKGLLVPKFQKEDIFQRLKAILQQVKPQTIILNGDLKHEFGRVLRQEWKDVLALIDLLVQHCAKLVIVRGNHDSIIGPIAEKRNVQVVPQYRLGETLIVHGHQLVKTDARRIVIGHEHPAISLREKGKIEKFKCFLQGKWKRKELIVLPSFNPLWEGTDILKERLLSPFLESISSFRVWVVSEQGVLDFGEVKNLR